MECSFALKYLVKIISKDEEIIGSGVIVKLEEFPNNFFIFTSKHTFEDNNKNLQVEKNNFSIYYKKEPLSYKSYISLDEDIVIFLFDNNLDAIKFLEKVSISTKSDKFGNCFFRGYSSSETDEGSLCERCVYHQEVEMQDNLYRIQPNRNTDSLNTDGLTNAKGLSGSGLFIKNDKSLVGIIKEHEENSSFYNYVALAPLKDEILTKINDSLYNQITIPQHLIDEIKDKNVVLFVGNELSSEIGGFLSYKDFIVEILNSADDGFKPFISMLEQNLMTNSLVLNALKDKETSTIKDKIIELYGGIPNNDFMKTLWKFTSNIVTVNYDNLLESNIDNIKIISTDNNYNIPKNPNFRKLFKLHGRVEDIDNILIFEDDYKKFYSKRDIIKSIKNTFKDKTCLFIGFSTDEVYFDLMYNAIACKKKNYIVSTSQKNFSKYEFEPIFIENYQQLIKAFNEVLKEEIVVAKKTNIKNISNIKIDEIQKGESIKPKFCMYTASPLNDNIPHELGKLKRHFSKYSIDLYHKVLTEDDLMDSYDFDAIFIFTKSNKEKIIIEDEYGIKKSITLEELEENIDEVEKTFIFLDKEMKHDGYEILVAEQNKTQKVLARFLHKKFNSIKGKDYQAHNLETDLPPLIDKKNLINFVGRDTDIQNIIKKMLTVKEEHQILTIKGAGGLGKTTTVSKATVEIAERGKFVDGIKFVQCEFISDYEDFEKKISTSFDMNDALEFKNQIKEQDIIDESRLIILDNVETLLHIDDSEKIKELIRFISDYATIVITSREILNEEYEDVYELSELTTDEAEELFNKFYKVQKYDRKILRTEILENLLNKNPLAIKLVTKNLPKGKSLDILKDELEESFFDITSNDIEKIFEKESDLNIERTKSLFQSINYSYQKLSDKEKLALETLSLFPDGLHFENFKNFYNQDIKNDEKNQKKIKHKLENFSDRDIKSLEDKSLIIINSQFIHLQSIIGRFADFHFSRRSEDEQLKFYNRAYAYKEFIIDFIDSNKFRNSINVEIFDDNKNNFLKSLDYIQYIGFDDNKISYINSLAGQSIMNRHSDKKIITRLKILKDAVLENQAYNQSLEICIFWIEYYDGNFSKIFKKIQKKYPIDELLEKYNKENNIENIIGIYAMEGHDYKGMEIAISNNLIPLSSLFRLGEFIFIDVFIKSNLHTKKDDDFIYFEFLLNINSIDVQLLKKYIKSLYKTEHIEKTQCMYTLMKANKNIVVLKDIKKLIVVNPFTDGLKILMMAMKDEENSSKEMYEVAIEKLFHIKYYHVEAILIYSQYLKNIGDDDYMEWFEKGRDLADKHHYRYLLHQFNCLDSEVYTEYDENEYPLPEPLDYSGIIKKYGLDV